MPLSKQRKKASKKRVPRTATVNNKTSWEFKLHSSHVIELRNDPDFIAMIKVGRAMNALWFGLSTVAMSIGMRNNTEVRLHCRAGFVLGGYLHEAVTVVDRLKGRYLGQEAFEPLRKLVVEPEHRKVRRYARVVRNMLAFHLDEADITTARTLSHLKPKNYTVMSGDDLSYASFYFELADRLDMAFLADEFADGREYMETVEDVVFSMQDYANEFLMACHTFLQHLWTTKFADHTYFGTAGTAPPEP